MAAFIFNELFGKSLSYTRRSEVSRQIAADSGQPFQLGTRD